MNYVYILSESGAPYNEDWVLYTVGFHDPAGKWHPESDFNLKEEAAARCHYLNGGRDE